MWTIKFQLRQIIKDMKKKMQPFKNKVKNNLMPVEDYHTMTKMCKDQQNNNEQKKNLVSINF